jgi:hypothetical protein
LLLCSISLENFSGLPTFTVDEKLLEDLRRLEILTDHKDLCHLVHCCRSLDLFVSLSRKQFAAAAAFLHVIGGYRQNIFKSRMAKGHPQTSAPDRRKAKQELNCKLAASWLTSSEKQVSIGTPHAFGTLSVANDVAQPALHQKIKEQLHVVLSDNKQDTRILAIYGLGGSQDIYSKPAGSASGCEVHGPTFSSIHGALLSLKPKL